MVKVAVKQRGLLRIEAHKMRGATDIAGVHHYFSAEIIDLDL